MLLALGAPQHPEWGPEPPVAPYGREPLPPQKVRIPMIFPVLGVSRWNDGYGENRGRFLHTGIDIRAPKMTPIVAPISGTIGMKRESFWIYGDNGWVVLGTHLNDDNVGRHDHRATRDLMFAPDLSPGQHVQAGRFLGYVGESGDATAPHLHFELYAPGSGPTRSRIRDPYPSLKAAKVIGEPLVWVPNPGEHPRKGEIRFQGCVRRTEPGKGLLTLLLVAEQNDAGVVRPVSKVRYARFNLAPSVAQQAGGWEGLEVVSETKAIAVYARRKAGSTDFVARRISMD
ncbi:M23 family metallopeptidase [Fimbriimonas ginsengisoli]|nr:M23 family metallopeptidase [Fimbriimonas ginsengisoli]